MGEFLSLVEVNRFLQHQPAPLRDIALELRNLVASAAPQASERILWRGLSYFDAARGGPVGAGICQIEMHADHVRLSFIHGASLRDPEGLLQGNRKTKRYVRLAAYEDAPWEHLLQLIQASAALDPSSARSIERG